jgi:hypothetical protein
MANATLYAVIGRFFGASLQAAFAQLSGGNSPQNLDILQIVDEGGSILLNVDFTGAVHNPAVNPTTAAGGIGQTRYGQYYTRLTTGASTANLFADAFSQNVSQLDILQIQNIGGNISYWLDFLGVAHGS